MNFIRRLRWQFTALYLLAALALVLLVGGGAYLILAQYFQHTTDLALQNRMALEFRRQQAALPAELVAAEQQWYLNRGQATPDHPSEEEHENERHDNDAFEGELASVFVYALTPDGRLLAPANGPIEPDQAALTAALSGNADWRTLLLANGTRVRLLTYRITTNDGVSLLQAGRSLADQDQALRRMVLGLALLGGASAAFLGLASWWLAGRSLAPSQHAWERQQAFVANSSHELRTPLTLIRASAEFAQRGLPEGSEHHGLMRDILHETDHMSRLVDDLLLLSRLDAGRLNLEHHKFDLGGLLAEAGPALSRLAAERGIRLNLVAAPMQATGDATRTRQVLLILFDNALRYTSPGGEIKLAVQPHGRFARMSVNDTGSGIAPEHIPHLFERFYRADPARTNRDDGNGLGLAIAKALVEAQHGQIGVETTLAAGSTFWFTLPLG
jgi:signal transduction histidine kinase